MPKLAVALLALISCVASLRAPAAANITNAVLSTTTPAYTGACPATIEFSGTISGTRGTSFVLTWNRFINNKQTTVDANNGNPLTLSGATVNVTMNVNDVMQVPVNADNKNGKRTFDQIWLHYISGGQTDVYSMPEATFSVTCFTLNPNIANQANPTNPKLKLPSNVITQAYVAAPSGTKTTNNEQECGSHGAGFACPAAMSNQWLVLVWCWGPNNCGPSAIGQHVDKFNIYEVDNGKHAYVTSTSPDQSGNLATAGFVTPPNGGFSNQCYAVTAVYGKVESVPSSAACLGSGTIGSVDTVFHAMTSMIQGESQASGHDTFPLSSGECAPGPLCLGWYHDSTSIEDVVHLSWYDDNYRSYYLFDLSSIAGHYVTSATLRVPVTGGRTDCFWGIAAANASWDPNTSFLAYIGGDFRYAAPITNPIDVTDIVRGWVAGQSNYGFVLRGNKENLDAENAKCITALGSDATLEIVHS
jgi:hypothetical protein